MAWQTPKTDWASNNGILNSDLNRIEGNIDYLKSNIDTSMVISGCLGGTADITMTPSQVIELQVSSFVVPASKSLYLSTLSFHLGNPALKYTVQDYLRLVITTDPDNNATYESTSSRSHVDFGASPMLLYTNSNQTDRYTNLIVKVVNNSVSNTGFAKYSGWTIKLSIK